MFKKTFKKIIEIIVFFMVETVFQVTCVTVFLFIVKKPIGVNFFQALWDVSRYMGGLKVIIFLPVYMVYYLINQNHTNKFVINHFFVHLACLAVIAVLLFQYILSSKFGLILSFLAIVISYLTSFLFNLILSKLILIRAVEIAKMFGRATGNLITLNEAEVLAIFERSIGGRISVSDHLGIDAHIFGEKKYLISEPVVSVKMLNNFRFGWKEPLKIIFILRMLIII
jgi:hypothetical protein